MAFLVFFTRRNEPPLISAYINFAIHDWGKLIMTKSFNRPARLHLLEDDGNILTTPTNKDTLWENLRRHMVLQLHFQSIKKNFQS